MGYSVGAWDMIDTINDRTLAMAGDDYTEADLWDMYMEQKAAEYRKVNGAYSVPSKELFKEWVREAQDLTQDGFSNGGLNGQE